MKFLLIPLLSIFLVQDPGPDARIFGKTWYLRYVKKDGRKQDLPEGSLENKLWFRLEKNHSFKQQSEDGLEKGSWTWVQKTKTFHLVVPPSEGVPDNFYLRLKRVTADTLELEYTSEHLLVGMISDPKK
jgi:hypothetical protein